MTEQVLIQIYALLNPETEKYFYVGMTTQRLCRRLNNHMNTSDKNRVKVELIQNLAKKGIRPKIVLLESMYIRNFMPLSRNEKEIFWIKKLLSEGHDLVNINYIKRAAYYLS